MSGFTARSYRVGPRELYVVTASSDRVTVPNVFNAPTVIADGELPGDVMPPRTGVPSAVLPAFPADATTTMPACTASATASQSGSVAAGSITGWPSERLMTRMLYRDRFAIAHSMPA